MTSEVQIYNLALSHIGARGRVQDPNENGNEAEICKQHYILCVRELQTFDYAFLKRSRTLPQVPNDWPQRYRHAYDVPNEALKILRLVPPVDLPGARPLPFELRDGKLYCDHSPAVLEYTRPVTDPTLFPIHFVDALSWALAARICFPVTKDARLRETTYQIAQQRRNRAEAHEANNEWGREEWTPPHIEART